MIQIHDNRRAAGGKPEAPGALEYNAIGNGNKT
jgi:hypothetical protein